MERRTDIGLDSYDRLFPNQDTMPQGGFGNLIALPLQRFIRFALGTGCRLDEIRGITAERDIDWLRGTVHVIGKFRQERDVPMQPDARAALEEQPRG